MQGFEPKTETHSGTQNYNWDLDEKSITFGWRYMIHRADGL